MHNIMQYCIYNTVQFRKAMQSTILYYGGVYTKINTIKKLYRKPTSLNRVQGSHPGSEVLL